MCIAACKQQELTACNRVFWAKLKRQDGPLPAAVWPLSTCGFGIRVENEDREPDPTLLNALESFAPGAVGANWGAALDVELIANLGRYRRYDYTCLRDLLRVVRNKRNHFREMPESLQQLMGPLPTGYYRCAAGSMEKYGSSTMSATILWQLGRATYGAADGAAKQRTAAS